MQITYDCIEYDNFVLQKLQNDYVVKTFDCSNIKPGIYTGYLNVTPLSFNRFISVKHKADGLLVKDTSTKKIPFTLEVLPIKLDDNALPLNGFRGGVYQYHFDFMKDYNVCMHMVTPWYFTVKFNNDGSILNVSRRLILSENMQVFCQKISLNHNFSMGKA